MRDAARSHDSHDVPAETRAPTPGKFPSTARIARMVMRAADGDNGVKPGAEAAVEGASSSSGAPLPDDLRGRFEQSLGADLSAVRVHTGDASAAAAQAVGARAYATGNDIHFAAGQYAPADPFGVHLLAHEVAHTVQQSGGGASAGAPQYKLEVGAPGDAAEVEADRAADAMVSGAPAVLSTTSGANLHRDPDPPAAKKALRDPAIIVSSLGQHYQTLMEKRIAGLDNLLDDLRTKDQPSVTDQVLQAAVTTGLSLAAGYLAAPLVSAAVSAVTSRISAAAAAKAIETGGVTLDQFLADYQARTSALTSKINGAIASAAAAAVGKAFAGKNGAMDPIRSFYEAGRDALIDAKMKAQDEINTRAGEFNGDAGAEMAEGVRDGVDQASTRAQDSQYMASLSSWSSIPNTGTGGALTLTLPGLWARGGMPVVGGAEFSANQAIRTRLQQNSTMRGRRLTEFQFAMTIRLATAWKPFAGSAGWTASGSTNGNPTSYPTSGSGAYDLWAFTNGKNYSGNPEEPELALGAQTGAYLLFYDLGQLTWGQLPILQ